MAVLGNVKKRSLISVLPVKERKILTFLLVTFVHDVSSVLPLVSDSSVWIMTQRSEAQSQLLCARVCTLTKSSHNILNNGTQKVHAAVFAPCLCKCVIPNHCCPLP